MRSIPASAASRVATQYKAHSLIRHLQRGWNFFRPERNESFDILPASQRVSETQWYAGTADAVYQNIDIIESYGPQYMVILAGDHIYKMDYEMMLQQHVDTGADVTVGCLEVPRSRRPPASASCTSTNNDRIIDFVEKPKNPPRHAGQSGRRAGQHGHLRLRDRVSDRPAAPRRRRPEFEPRFRQGHHSLPRQERQGGGASLLAVLRALERGSQAYWRDVGTVDAYWEANIDLTDVVPELDLYDRNWPIWTYAEITPPAKFVHDVDGRRGSRSRSLVSGGCIVSGASLSRSLLFTGVRVHSFAPLDEAVDPALCRDRPQRAGWPKRRHRPRRAHSRRPGRRRGSRYSTPSASAAPKTASCLITQPMIDKLDAMSELNVLSVASEIFPLIKTGGLADVAGALPRALAREGVAMRTLVPGYPAVMAKLAGARRRMTIADLFGGPARVARGQRRRARPVRARRAASLRPAGNPYLGPDGLDWPDNARRFAALARVGADIGLGAIDDFRPQVVHAHDWQAALAPAYLHYDGGPRPARS